MTAPPRPIEDSWPIKELLPHAPPLLLLDRALACDGDGARASVTIGPDLPGASADGVPAHVGLELMAQTCGVWAGGQARRQGGEVRVGYLLGTRRYRAARPFLPLGQRLEVEARLVFRDAAMGVFDCRLTDAGGQVLAEAQLSVFQPGEDADKDGEES